MFVRGLNNTLILDDFECSSLALEIEDEGITYKHILKSYSDQRRRKKETEYFCAKRSGFLNETIQYL
jgi:hypothetical protein